jgi:endonuclease/exonuclease/phosphatase family metal-dependent hydrolase
MTGYLVVKKGSQSGLIIAFKEGSQWILGKDPNEATFIVKDPLASKKHVICYRRSKGFTLKNLNFENPATLNGKIITEETLLKEGDILMIGSTSFRFTEKKQAGSSAVWLLKSLSRYRSSKELIFSPNMFITKETSSSQNSWKDFVIPSKYIQWGGLFVLCLLGFATADLSLSRTPSINRGLSYRADAASRDSKNMTPYKNNAPSQLEEICSRFPELKFSFDRAKGKLFLSGHVATISQKQELTHALSPLSFIKSTEDTVITDELVWQGTLETKIHPFISKLKFREKAGQILNHWGQQFVRPVDHSVENCTQVFTAKTSSKLHKIATAAMHAITFTYEVILYEIGDAIDRTGDFLKTRPYNYLKGTAQEKPLAPANSFSLLSANLCMLPYGIWAYEGLKAPSQRIETLAKKILDTHSDFVCLQEMGAAHANALWKKLQDHYAHGFARVGPMPIHRMNNGLFFASKYPIEKTLYYPLPNTGTIDRGVFCAKSHLGWIIVGHLQAGKSELDILTRKQQVEAIEQLCRYLSKEGTIPCLLAMDSNIPRLGGKEDEYTLSRIPEYFQNGLYSNSSFSLTPEKATCTNIFSLALQGKEPQSIQDAYEHIDYILSYKPSSHLISLKTSQIQTYSRSHRDPLSDHKILLAKIQPTKQFIRQMQGELKKR